ncbi:MFS transporter [Xenorhabdus bharatensis]|uniref:MFS transporter n=1 Tax=Xenorhabdus bharatensis TaxID=3136256 RepID=UPI0030F46C9A
MNNKSSYRWFILIVGVLAQATFAMGFAGIPVTGILMRDDYHFSLFSLGVVLGAMGLGVAISEIFWGMLTDKLGDKTVLILGLWLSASAFTYISFFLTPENSETVNYLHLSTALMAAGAFGGSINSSSGRTVMSWFDDTERGFAMSIRQTAIPIGGAIGTGLLPWIAYSYGFQITFIILAITGLSVGIFVLIFVNSKHAEIKNTHPTNFNIKSPLKKIEVWKVTLAAGFLTVPQMAVLTFGGVYMKDILHINLSLIAFILIGVQIGGGALRIWSGYYTDKKKNRIQLIKQLSVLGGISSLILCFVVDSTIFGIILLILTGLFGHAWHGIAYTETAVKAGVERAGTALGMIGTTVFISSFLTPIMISRILDCYNWTIVWGIVGLLTLVSLLCLIDNKKLKIVKLNSDI